jgi:hypothetical protein
MLAMPKVPRTPPSLSIYYSMYDDLEEDRIEFFPKAFSPNN